jgi:hypothetical protein
MAKHKKMKCPAYVVHFTGMNDPQSMGRYIKETYRQKDLPFKERRHGLIKYIDTKAKCRSSKKMTCKEILLQVFICLRPFNPRFSFEVV